MKTTAFVLLTLLLCVGIAAAQNNCPDIVQTALQAAEDFCTATARNQACFGNVALTAESQPGVSAFNFDSQGDITDVASIRRLALEPMNTAAGTWGLVIMQLQADLPDTMPGQNVTVILFGDVQIENAAAGAQNPMQAFYLQSGVGDAPCAEAPESGMMVQTPQGIGQVAFNVNGVDVQMGSTVTFQARPGDKMRIQTLEGSASIEIEDTVYPIVQGTLFEAGLDENYLIDTANLYMDYYTADMIDNLPLGMLERDIIPTELTDEQFEEIYQDISDGTPLCSDEAGSYLPSCEDVIPLFGGEACVYQPSSDAPLCEEANPCAYLPADEAAGCQENLQELIDSGAFEGDDAIDFSNPCAIVPAEYADDCAGAVQNVIDTGVLPDFELPDSGVEIPDIGGHNPRGDSDDDGSDESGGEAPPDNAGDEVPPDNSGGEAPPDNSGAEAPPDNSGGDNGGGEAPPDDSGGGDGGGESGGGDSGDGGGGEEGG